MQNLPRVKVWLDCDPGNDDAMAVVLALFHPKCELIGISTVFGNNRFKYIISVNIDRVTKNAIRLLSCFGRTDIPVFKGAKQSLTNTMIEESDIHGREGMFGAEQMNMDFEISEAASLYELIKERVGEERFTFVMTGAQTNGALLFGEHPTILDQIDKVIFMGGSAGYGNVSPNAEFNLYADPHACHQVLNICQQKNIELVMVGLDITHTVLVTDEIKDRITAINKPFSKWCSEMLYEFAHAYKQEEFDYPPLHDPVALYFALFPDDFKSRLLHMEVETESALCMGRTVCDKFNALKKEKNVRFCESVNLNQFWNCMIDAIAAASAIAKLN